jgi:hypothetical protein
MSQFLASYTYVYACASHDLTDELLAHLSEMRARQKPPRSEMMRRLFKLVVSRRNVAGTMACMDSMLDAGDRFDPLPAIVLLANAGAFDSHPAEAERLLASSIELVRPTGLYSSDKLHVLERSLPLLPRPDLKMRVINVLAVCAVRSPCHGV